MSQAKNRREVKNWYIKDTGDGRSYMSGLSIPKDKDGLTEAINFVNCDFHYASYGVFIACQIDGIDIPDGPGCLKEYDMGSIEQMEGKRMKEPSADWMATYRPATGYPKK
jgi:hypothetical protein